MRFAIYSIIMAMPFITGCAGCQNSLKHAQSDIFGLNRKITLYGSDGQEVRTWKTQAKVEDRGGSCYFIADGKAIIVSGTFVIEEI